MKPKKKEDSGGSVSKRTDILVAYRSCAAAF
jgi:hypothetical protein